MSRRNQARRRQSYGRRQHEVRERRPEGEPEPGWMHESDAGEFELRDAWQAAERGEQQQSAGAQQDYRR